jgi:prepilin peptidase CpaA
MNDTVMPHMDHIEAARVLLLLTLTTAVITDARRNKVFNWLTFPAMILGIAVAAGGGKSALLTSVEGLAAGLAAGLVFMVFFRSGAGDAKLLMAVGALSTPGFVVGTSLYGAIAAFPMAVVLTWRRGVLKYTFANLATNAAQRAVGNTEVDFAENSRAGKMPYAVALAVGSLITYLLCGWVGIKIG